MIVFTHIPKTSGTSFYKGSLEPNLGAANIHHYRTVGHFLRRRGFRASCVIGHVPYGLHHLVSGPVSYITFLREPVDHAISYYYFVKDSDPREYVHPARHDAERHDLVGFYRLRKYQNWQTRYLAGLISHKAFRSMPSAQFDAWVYRRALEHLHNDYFCLGLFERFDESTALFDRVFGWESSRPVEPQKQTKGRPALEAVDAAARHALAQANQLDGQLYAAAVRRFEEIGRRFP